MEEPVHHCHADGCSEESHPEVPFCKKHFQQLPKEAQERLWKTRWPAKKCGVCHHSEGFQRAVSEGLWPDYKEWFELVHKGIAFLLVKEYGPHDCPESLVDDRGFCWGCGIQGVPEVFEVVKAWC